MIYGILGLISIIVGITLKDRIKQDICHATGGILLLVYAVDPVFIILEIVFTIVAVMDLLKQRRKR